MMANYSQPQPTNRESLACQAVIAFYQAFNDGFVGECDFAAEDWNHISPFGEWAVGHDAVLEVVRRVHATFLKGVTDTIEEVCIRFAAQDVAVATVISCLSPFVTPDGTRHENERHIRTFVVVERDERWRVMHDQNTVIVR
jgi:uncharacterized protein (TIGR02246 family)